ncbi:MAG TPA: carboxypeptidase regulatory-like domain-containing protein [Bacteroidales bacterium]|nr:carboxypeptidase regulatory-like domain-containing protein [Bacteroidales bacterium]
MNKKYLIFMVLLMGFVPFVVAQNYWLQKTINDPQTGRSIETTTTTVPPGMPDGKLMGDPSMAPGINWQFTDPAGIGSRVVVDDEQGFTFNSWWLNNERVSLWDDSNVPLWEMPVPTEWEYPIDMTSDGMFVNVAFDNSVYIYNTATQALVWELTIPGQAVATFLSEDGAMLYVLENEGDAKCLASAYEVGNTTPLWQTGFISSATIAAASGDRSRLAVCQYSGANKLWVIDTETGEVIFDAGYKNQNPPAFSYDGNILLNGDYSGYAYLYKYNEELNTYEEQWYFKVGGGGSSAWVVGMAVSADGTTAAIGTLVFLSGGSDGEIYLFDTYSPVPRWVYGNCGDEIAAVSLSDDGAMLAAAGYGPLDQSKPDAYIFRRESNEPIFTLTTPGSFFDVDMSGDGMMCSATGKAVHAGQMGSGGLLYNLNTNPGGGALAGSINEDLAKIEIEGIDDYYNYSENGEYLIRFIPAGTYTVRASKVGFYPVTVENVVITEGGQANLDFTLEATGDAPYHLMATQGAALSVDLWWDYDNPSNIEGFNIYRKTIELAQFPEEPIATVGNTALEFSDTEALPLTTYYYAVTAKFSGDVQSPYSEVAEGFTATGFVIDNISVYVGSTPVIDGTISEGEWDDAFVMDASDFLGINDNTPNPVGSVTMYYKMNEAMTELYVACINTNDTVLEDHDEVALYIDDNNDGVYPAPGDNSEGNYWAVYYAAGNEIRYRPIYNTGGVGDVVLLENPQIEVSIATGVVVYEFMIPIGDDADWKISPNEDNQSGLFLFVLDDPIEKDGYWPAENLQVFDPVGYGTITFGAEDLMPEPPQNGFIWWDRAEAPITVLLSWDYPEMNDFDHFNVFIHRDGNSELVAETIGSQLVYVTDNNDYATFTVTTVDQAQNESEESEPLIFDVTVGISQPELEIQAQVYPNPSSGEVTVAFATAFATRCNIEVLAPNGTLLEVVFDGVLDTGKQQISWQPKEAAPGIYFMRIRTAESTIIRKILMMP